VTEHIDAAKKAIDDRIATLKDELKRLEAAATALGGTRRRGPGRPARAASRRRRGRPRGSGTRALQAEKLVRENPGITISELAAKMKIKPNYLYRVLPQLQKDGKVRKRGSGWHAA
jgi:Winged helix-turn-helix DNA-binding